MAIESVVSGGCIVSGSVHRSVLFSNVRVHSYSTVSWSVLLPEAQVGRRARLTRCVIDRGVMIPDDMVIGEDAELDAARFLRSENGITLVTRGMLDKLMT
jgi:glucose-1-phosphate adenylyltransferase